MEGSRHLAAAAVATLVERQPDPTLVLDADGRTLYANAAAVRLGLYGSTTDRFADHLHPEDRIQWRDVVVPVLARAGHWAGTMQVMAEGGGDLPVSVTALALDDAGLVGITCRDRSAEVELERTLLERVDRDELTGTLSRARLEWELSQAIAGLADDRGPVAVCFIDLDGFKAVNDLLGHDAGDDVLREVADRLRAATRDGDALARLGGDEFVLLLRGIGDAGVAEGLAHRLIAALADPIDTVRGEARVGASAGIYVARTPDETPERALRRADTAMYEAKRRGKGRCAVFEERLHSRESDQVALGALLQDALDGDQFIAVYRPVASVRADRVVGLEAGLCWRNPERGRLRLSDFAEAAARSGMLHRVEQWLWERSCAHLERWRRVAPDVVCWVSLSERLLLGTGFVDTLAAGGGADRIIPGSVGVEVSTDLLRNHPRQVATVAERLDRVGVLVGLNDFGSGPVSVAMLAELPIHTVKLHDTVLATVLRGGNAGPALRAIAAVPRELGIRTQAKGLADPAHLELLADLGVDLVSGSLVGRHEPAALTGSLLEATAPAPA